MGSQSSKLVSESQQRKEHLVQLSEESTDQHDQSYYNNTRKDQTKMVNTIFKWNFGGNSVYVTGTFSEWIHHVQLQKQGQEFSAIVRLPPGVHQYKFIVDGEWRFSPEDCQTTDENGNINNIIDTTNYDSGANNFYVQESHQRPVPPTDHRPKDIDSFDTFEFEKLHVTANQNQAKTTANHKQQQQQQQQQPQHQQQYQTNHSNGTASTSTTTPAYKNNTIELQNDRYGFSNAVKPIGQNIPAEFNFKDKAPPCPPHLRDVYFLKQKELNTLNHWKETKVNPEIMSEEEVQKQLSIEKHEILIRFFNSDRSLAPPQHVTTKHTGIKTMKNQTYNVYCITQRFKQKYSTFKFFTNQYVENTDKIFIA